jgi:DNA polymerase-1
MEKTKEKETLIVIDGNSVVHRAYHALPKLTAKTGELANAVYGFISVFIKAVNDFHPDYIVAAFDFPAPTFRHKKYKEYKATRPKADEELYAQIPIVKDVLKSFGVLVLSKEGYEADDIIGTVIQEAKKNDLEKIILSGDSDSFQLVDAQTKVSILRQGVKDVVLFDERMIREKFSGLTPKQLIDYKSLKGDPSDNIPGVKGIGEKTAMDLLLKFGDVKNLYKEIEENSPKAKEIREKIKDVLIKGKNQAILSMELVIIDKEVPVGFDLENSVWNGFGNGNLIQKMNELGFDSLLKRMQNSGKESSQLKQGRLL